MRRNAFDANKHNKTHEMSHKKNNNYHNKSTSMSTNTKNKNDSNDLYNDMNKSRMSG